MEDCRRRTEADQGTLLYSLTASSPLTVSQPVINFSQNACRSRFDALKEGTAKPTPESILDPDENVLARIQSRLEKEKKIEDDALLFSQHAANLQGNAWTSRPVKYF